MKRPPIALLVLTLALAAACKKPAPPPLYEAVAVSRRDITVSAEAAGAVEAITVVNVKSRASGTILKMPAATGMHVRTGDTLVLVDKRDPTNSYNQARAELAVAQATLQNADSGKQRMDAMYAHQLVSEQDRETANLTYSSAQAQVVRAQIQLQQATDALNDCNVLASVNGVILTKGVDVGTVIASAVNQVSGGTTLLTMANLDTVQLRVQVDETDIGKIQPGLSADITVDAFPNRPFRGQVLKIEPQSTVNNNVTMFPVLIWIPNPDGLLLPGMNAEVQIHVAATTNVLAIPNAALRTQRDVGSAAQVLGLNPTDVQRQLAQVDSQAAQNRGQLTQQPAGGQSETSGSMGGRTPADGRKSTVDGQEKTPGSPPTVNRQPSTTGQAAPRTQGGTPRQATGQADAAQSGGASMDEIRAAFTKQRSGQTLTPHEQQVLQQARSQFGGGGGGGGGMRRGGGSGNSFIFGGSYIVFVKRAGKPTPVRVRTGVTDMDYSEVKSGLVEGDTVLLLPSASLVQSQQDMKDRFARMTGGGGVPGMQQQTARPTTQAQPAGPRN